MGKVLQLRKPRQTLGHDDVIFVPRESNSETARAVLARPSDHTKTMLRAACIWLRDNGDWLDQERARHMLRALDLQEADEAWWARERRELMLAGLFAVVLLVAIAVFDAAWGQHLAAGALR